MQSYETDYHISIYIEDLTHIYIYVLSKIYKTSSFVFFGKGGIRTPGDRKATPIFKIGAINHSATFPFNYLIRYIIYI